MEVFPVILTMPPRDARSHGLEAATSYKLFSLVDDREGVGLSPLGGEWIQKTDNQERRGYLVQEKGGSSSRPQLGKFQRLLQLATSVETFLLLLLL